MEVKYSLTNKEFNAGEVDNKYNSNKFKFIKILYVYFQPLALFLCLFEVLKVNDLFLYIIVCIFGIMLFKHIYEKEKNIKKKYNFKNPNIGNEIYINIKLNKSGLFMIQNNIEFFLSWSLITKVVESNEYLHIYNSKNLKIFIPKNLENFNEIKKVLKKYVNNNKLK